MQTVSALVYLYHSACAEAEFDSDPSLMSATPLSVCILALEDHKLRPANLGGSGFLFVRKRKVVLVVESGRAQKPEH